MSPRSKRRDSPRWRRTAPSLALFAISLLFSLGVGELGVRIAAPQRLVRSYYAPDAELGSIIRADQRTVDDGELYTFAVRTNEAGLRMDVPVDHSANAHRVLALGDSFTFGWGVEIDDSFVQRIGDHVGERVPRTQLLNGGVGAYSSGHVYKALQRRTAELDPCAAIYFLNSNDLEDNLVTGIEYRVTSFESLPDGSIALTDERVHSPLKRFLLVRTPYGWLNQHSHLFVLLKQLASDASRREGPDPDPIPSFGVGVLSTERADLAIDVALAHVDRIGALADERKLPLLIVWIPAWTEIFQPDTPTNEVFQRLKHGLAARDTPLFHDPLPLLQQLVVEDGVEMLGLYYRDGDPVGHYTPKGNDLFARAVREPIARFVQKGCSHGP